MRAAHQVLDDEPLVFRDPVAVGLTHGASRAEIENRRSELSTPSCKLLRSAFVLRARYAEDELARAVRNGVGQYVVLGAGLDTFALRQPVHARCLQIFEVDQPSTQAWKLDLLSGRRTDMASNLAYVAVDLQGHQLQAALQAVGFRRDLPAFFSCLGVTQYLEEGALESILCYIASLAAGSGIVFSFNPPADTLEGLDLAEAVAAAARSAALSEAWRTRPTAELLDRRLRRLGFRTVSHLSPEEAQTLYFGPRADGLRAPRFEQLIGAFV